MTYVLLIIDAYKGIENYSLVRPAFGASDPLHVVSNIEMALGKARADQAEIFYFLKADPKSGDFSGAEIESFFPDFVLPEERYIKEHWSAFDGMQYSMQKEKFRLRERLSGTSQLIIGGFDFASCVIATAASAAEDYGHSVCLPKDLMLTDHRCLDKAIQLIQENPKMCLTEKFNAGL
ncbi:MAG: isochorismatase family protein [Nanoarchaeota archaeon]|nr:isochorismatase family protein [Nanoarchaeota archaeon]